MRQILALGSIGLGLYLIVTDGKDGTNHVPTWLPWVLVFIVPIIAIQA